MAKHKRVLWHIIILAIIICVGTLPRAVEILSGNYLFGFDQGLFFERVKSIAVDHKLTLIGEKVGGVGGFFQGPGFYYLLSIPFILFRGDPYGAMLLMFGIGVSTIIVGSIFSYMLFGFVASFFITSLLAFSPALVSQSRFIWNPFPVPIIILGCLFALFGVLKQKKYMLLILFLLIGLLFHFEIATGIMVLIEFLICCVFLLWRKIIQWKYFVSGLFIFFLTQIHFLLFDLRHDFLITKGITSIIVGKAWHVTDSSNIQHILSNHFDVFRSTFHTTFVFGNKLWPLFIIMIVLGIVGILRDGKADKSRTQFIIMLAIAPIISFVLYAKYLAPMWGWWIFDLEAIAIVLFGLVCSWWWSRGTIWRIIVGLLMCLFFIGHMQQTIQFYRSDYHDYGGTNKIRGKIDAISSIYQDAKGKPFNLLVFTPPVYTYPYDYLLWWYGLHRYGYMPGKDKQGTLYLLIDIDSSKPWSYIGWLDTIIKNGKTVATWTLPSGFVIQKRIFEP